MKLVVLVCASLALSGCLTTSLVKDLSPDQKAELLKLAIERCGGDVTIGGAGGTGQMGGGISGDFRFNGKCPVPQVGK